MLDATSDIARKLDQAALGAPRGDIKTAQRLLAAGNLSEYDEARFGPLFSSPRPPGLPQTPKKELKPAAVLIALLQGQAGYDVLLTRRTEDLPTHKGQISFPGGRVDDTDADAVAAALREAWEETSLPMDQVDVLGRLDSYITVTAYDVTPVVGVVARPVDLTPEPGEVGEIFTVPLDHIMDPANHLRETRTVDGLRRAYYAIPYQDKYIWGATAGMLINLYEVLSGTMTRIFLMYLVPFLLPLTAYLIFAWYRAKFVASHEGEAPSIEKGPWPYLLLAGALLTVGVAGTMALLGGADPGSTYTPARIEDGRVVPGTTD